LESTFPDTTLPYELYTLGLPHRLRNALVRADFYTIADVQFGEEQNLLPHGTSLSKRNAREIAARVRRLASTAEASSDELTP
jgi:hypothetical protein